MVFKQPLLLKPSYLFAGILLFIHLGAVIALMFLALSWFVLLPIILIVLIHFLSSVRRYALLLSAKSIIKLWPKEKNEWVLQDKTGNYYPVKLRGNSYRSLYLVVLNFIGQNNNKKLAVIILPDNLPEASFRRLRAQLFVYNNDTIIL